MEQDTGDEGCMCLVGLTRPYALPLFSVWEASQLFFIYCCYSTNQQFSGKKKDAVNKAKIVINLDIAGIQAV